MRACVLLIVGLLWAGPVEAANWLKGCQATSGTVNQSMGVGSIACNIPVSATDDSGILDVSACENIDILYFDDVDGDAVAGAATVIVRSCPDPLLTSTDAVRNAACWAMENVTFDGNPATNTEAIYGIAANWLKVDITAYLTVTEPIRVIVRCNGSPR